MGFFKKTLEELIPQSKGMLTKIDVNKELRLWKKNEVLFTAEYEKDKNYIPVPHVIKENMIRSYAHKYHLGVFVETGTYLGIMVNALRNDFQKLYSIELSEILYRRAVKIFADDRKINIRLGDSGVVLPQVVAELTEPALFWLDGHYSGGVTGKADIETPIMRELEHVFNHPIKKHVILIDDARLFIGERDYPTFEGLKNFVAQHIRNYTIEVRDDIIIIINND
jgi:hypothetical protein